MRNPRGRPKKYLTKEEQRQADCEKSKRSHERRKDDVNRKRRERYREGVRRKLKALADGERSQGIRARDPKLKERLDRMALEDAQTKSQDIFSDFEDFIKGSSKSFVTLICERYLERYPSCPESALKIVEMYVEKITRYQDLLRSEQNEILNLAGIGEEYKEADRLRKQVGQVILWLDDICCAALEPGVSVEKMYRQKKFEFLE